MKEKIRLYGNGSSAEFSLAACGSGEACDSDRVTGCGYRDDGGRYDTCLPQKRHRLMEELWRTRINRWYGFNCQPSSSATGQLDMTALNYNKDTYYVGFDANQGAELREPW